MLAEKSNKIRAKPQLNFAWRLSTLIRKVRKDNDQILAQICSKFSKNEENCPRDSPKL